MKKGRLSMDPSYQGIPTPAVWINLDTAYRNITKMVQENEKYGIAHRPHIKVHKSSFLAKKQIELGAKGITCAKISEAEVMVNAGITDILIAYPLIGQDKWDRFAELSRRADLITIVNSTVGAEGLSKVGERLGKPVRVLIEVDGGINRGGLKPGQPVLEFAEAIRHLKGLDICGVMYYGGAIYGQKTLEGIRTLVKREHDDLVGNRDLLVKNGFKIDILSGGSSFSSKQPDLLEGITEVRAGNYIFNDCAQLPIGLVTEGDCALRVISTVVCRPDEHTAIIDAGSKTLTSDLAHFRSGYGYIVGHPDIEIYQLNEEHGFLRYDKPIPFEIGEKIAIIPNHACVVTNINENVYGVSGGKVVRKIDIDARAKNY